MSAYVCGIVTVVRRLTVAAVATYPHHRIVLRRDDTLPTSKTSLEMTRQPYRSIKILQFRFVYVYTITTDAPAAAPRLMAAFGDRLNDTLPTSKTSPAMTRIDRNSANTQIYAYEIKQRFSKNFFLLLRMTPRLTALCTVYFPAITRHGFCFHIRKIISR